MTTTAPTQAVDEQTSRSFHRVWGGRGRRLRRGAVTIVVVLAIWQALPTLGIVNSFLVPPPSTVVQRVFTLAGPNADPHPYALLLHIGWSVARLMCGVAIGCVIGIPAGFAMATNRVAEAILRPILSVTLPVPTLAWAPILILYLGLNNKTTIAVVALEASLLLAYNAAMGASAVPTHMKWAIASMGAGRLGLFTRVVLPASLPPIVTAVKLSVGYGWRALVAAESLAATSYGLGYMIFQAESYLDTQTIFAGIATIAIVGLILERLIFGRMERRVNGWYVTAGHGA